MPLMPVRHISISIKRPYAPGASMNAPEFVELKAAATSQRWWMRYPPLWDARLVEAAAHEVGLLGSRPSGALLNLGRLITREAQGASW